MERIESGVALVEGFIGAIRPPRLDDCALPSKSAMESFSRIAGSIKSRIATSFSGSADQSVAGEGGGCIQDSGDGQISDKLLIGEIFAPAMPLCGNGVNQAEIEDAKDDVVIIGAGYEGEGGELECGGKGGCTGGGELLPGVKNGRAGDGDWDDDDEHKDGPILVQGLI